MNKLHGTDRRPTKLEWVIAAISVFGVVFGVHP